MTDISGRPAALVGTEIADLRPSASRARRAVDAVAGSWPVLVTRLDAGGALAGWAGSEPVLARVNSVGELPLLLRRGGDRDLADAVLGAFVRLGAADGGDDADAVLVAVHLLADGVAALASRFADLVLDPVPWVVGQVVATLRGYPWRRRTRAHARGVLLDAKSALLEEAGLGRRIRYRTVEVLCAEVEPDIGLRGADRPVEPAGGTECRADGEVEDLFGWAAATGVAAVGDLRLLTDLAAQQCLGRGHGGAAVVAQRYGVATRTVRRRRDAVLTAIRAAIPAYLRDRDLGRGTQPVGA